MCENMRKWWCPCRGSQTRSCFFFALTSRDLQYLEQSQWATTRQKPRIVQNPLQFNCQLSRWRWRKWWVPTALSTDQTDHFLHRVASAFSTCRCRDTQDSRERSPALLVWNLSVFPRFFFASPKHRDGILGCVPSCDAFWMFLAHLHVSQCVKWSAGTHITSNHHDSPPTSLALMKSPACCFNFLSCHPGDPCLVRWEDDRLL